MWRHGWGRGLLAALTVIAAAPAAASAANSAPQCFAGTSAVSPNGTRLVSFDCVDPDRGPGVLTVTPTQPAHGTLRQTAVGWRYTPHTGFTGTDTITFSASDTVATSNEATHTIVVTNENLAPRCRAQHVEAVNGRASVYAACSDPNVGQAVQMTVDDPPDHGTFRRNGPGFEYVAIGDYRGPDSFTLKAGDGTLTSETASFPVSVVDLTPPECDAVGTVPVRSDTSKQIPLTCRDNAGQGMFFSPTVVDAPDHGTLQQGMNGFTYHPDAGYEGRDQMTVRVVNSAGPSDELVVKLAVAEDANEQPQCALIDWPITLRTNGSTNVPIGCWDRDGDKLTYEVVQDPAHGALSLDGPAFPYNATYTADAGYAGPDSFKIRATDGRATSQTRDYEVRVVGPRENAPPDCFSTATRVRQGQQQGIALQCFDEERDPLTYSTTSPQHGSVSAVQTSMGTPWVSYTAPPSYAGADRFTFTATDDRGGSSSAYGVLVDVYAPEPLTCRPPQPGGVRTNKTRWFGFTCGSEEGPARISVVEQPAHGTLTQGFFDSVTYEPHKDYAGPDSFKVVATAGNQTVELVQDVVVSPDFNTKPSCSSDPSAATRAAEIELRLSCWDAENDPITIELVDPPSHGTLGSFASDHAVTYTPDPSFTGTDTFRFRPDDGRDDGATVEQTIAVRSATSNMRPACSSFGTFVAKDTDGAVTPWCTDGDDDPLTYAVVDPPDAGSVTWDAQAHAFRYTPQAGYEGWDEFTFTANDGRVGSTPARVTVQVGQPAGAPPCSDLAANVTAGEPRRLQLPCWHGGWGGNAEPVTYEIVEHPAHGAVTLPDAGGFVTYTPHADYVGEDTFRYRTAVGEHRGPTATARLGVGVRITKAPPRDDTSRSEQRTQTAAAPPPPPPEETPKQPQPPPPPADPFARLGGRVVPAPGVSLGSARAFVGASSATRGLAVGTGGTLDVLAVQCSTACTLTADPAVELPGARAAAAARGAVKLKRVRLKLADGRPGLVSVKLPKAVLKRLRKTRGAKLRLTLTVRDASGKTARDVVRFKLRP